MKETYVKIKEAIREEGMPDTYCPINLEKKTVTLGLTLIGFVPEGAQIVGEYEPSTGIFIPNWAKCEIQDCENKQQKTVKP
jgi:hypothetical protein